MVGSAARSTRAEPLGKDLRALRTSASEMSAGGGTRPVGIHVVGMGAWGCLVSIASRISGEVGARPPEHRAWMAFLYWPSSTAALARLALPLRGDP